MRYFYSAIQKIIEIAYRNCSKGCKIYMFHQVNDDRTVWDDCNVCISEQGFKCFIDKLIQAKNQFYPLEHLKISREGIYITFDDIFSDACENAIPYLIEKEIPFCVFVTSSYIGKGNFVTEKQIEWLKREPLCTIGYHAKNHLMMRRLNSKDIDNEIDSEVLERMIGRKCKVFAFPYGSLWACTKASVQKVAGKQYSMAFSTVSVPCTDHWWISQRFFLPRININEANYLMKV